MCLQCLKLYVKNLDPLRYYSPCQVYTTLRTINNPIQLLFFVRTYYEHHRTLFENYLVVCSDRIISMRLTGQYTWIIYHSKYI